MANMAFKANLLPNSDLRYSLGSSNYKWKINGVDDPKLSDTTYSAGTALSLSGTTFNVTTVPIANGGTGATTAQNAAWNILHVTDPGDLNTAKRLGIFKISSSTTNTPVSSMWGATWNIVDDSSGGNTGTNGSTWQLVFKSQSNDMWLRCITNTSSWTDYAKFLSDKNYSSYTVTKTGSGASGTWGISITGNAATATKISSTPNNTTTFLRGDNTWSNTLVGPLRIGGPDTAINTGYATDNVGSNNYIAFYGVYGDAVGGYNHTYIGERIYGAKGTANEQSELLLFKGNDTVSGGSGPDRIRLLASQTDIQCYTSALSGSFMSVGEAGGTQVARFRSDSVTFSTNISAPNFLPCNFVSSLDANSCS